MKKPGDWWWPCFSADTSEADVLRKAATMLDVPEKRIEVRRTGGAWLARERQDNANEITP